VLEWLAEYLDAPMARDIALTAPPDLSAEEVGARLAHVLLAAEPGPQTPAGALFQCDARSLGRDGAFWAEAIIAADRVLADTSSGEFTLILFRCSPDFRDGFEKVFKQPSISRPDGPATGLRCVLIDRDSWNLGVIITPSDPERGVALTLRWRLLRGLPPPRDEDRGVAPHPEWPPPYELLCAFPEEPDDSRAAKDSRKPDDVAPARSAPGDRLLTPFEHCVKKHIIRDVMGTEKLGCRVNDTHVRLSSAVHLDRFCEGDILVNSEVHAWRFAFLVLRDLDQRDRLEEASALSFLVAGWSTELLAVRLAELARAVQQRRGRGEPDVDYTIFEPGPRQDGWRLPDEIRYPPPPEPRVAKDDDSPATRAAHFANRRVVALEPTGATMGTLLRMVRRFAADCQLDPAAIEDQYALISLGSAGAANSGNPFWTKPEDQSLSRDAPLLLGDPPPAATLLCSHDGPKIRTFVEDNFTFFYPDQAADLSDPSRPRCQLCFPDRPLDERPLVNADAPMPELTHTLRAQASAKVGPLLRHAVEAQIKTWDESAVSSLIPCLLFGHWERRGRHFDFYIRTEMLAEQAGRDLAQALRDDVVRQRDVPPGLDILVCNRHYRSARFSALVNDVVFGGQAVVIRSTVNEEPRGAFATRFSWLKGLVADFQGRGQPVRCHFVDDAANSGRSFHRAETLMRDLLGDRELRFDWAFFMVDRLSQANEQAGAVDRLGAQNTFQFARLDLPPPHPEGRNGESRHCYGCRRLARTRDLLRQSATVNLARTFQDRLDVRFVLQHVGQDQPTDYQGEWGPSRFVCSQIVSHLLLPRFTQTWPELLRDIVTLMATDYEYRATDHKHRAADPAEARRYFRSYLAALARPTLSTHPGIRRCLLYLCVSILGHWLPDAFGSPSEKAAPTIDPVLRIVGDFTGLEREALYRQVLSHLAEISSTVLIRPELLEALLQFEQAAFGHVSRDGRLTPEEYHIRLIKTVLGGVAGTIRSAWLDRALESKVDAALEAPDQGLGSLWLHLALENNRLHFEAVRRLHRSLQAPLKLSGLADAKLSDDEALHLLAESNADVVPALQDRLISAYERGDDYVLSAFARRLHECGLLVKRPDQSVRMTEAGRSAVLSAVALWDYLEHFDGEKESLRDILLPSLMRWVLGAKAVYILLPVGWGHGVDWTVLAAAGVNTPAQGETARATDAVRDDLARLGASGEWPGWSLEDIGADGNRHARLAWQVEDYRTSAGGTAPAMGPVLVYAEFEGPLDPDVLRRTRLLMMDRQTLAKGPFSRDHHRLHHEVAQESDTARTLTHAKSMTHTTREETTFLWLGASQPRLIPNPRTHPGRAMEWSGAGYRGAALTSLTDTAVARVFSRAVGGTLAGEVGEDAGDPLKLPSQFVLYPRQERLPWWVSVRSSLAAWRDPPPGAADGVVPLGPADRWLYLRGVVDFTDVDMLVTAFLRHCADRAWQDRNSERVHCVLYVGRTAADSLRIAYRLKPQDCRKAAADAGVVSDRGFLWGTKDCRLAENAGSGQTLWTIGALCAALGRPLLDHPEVVTLVRANRQTWKLTDLPLLAPSASGLGRRVEHASDRE
jgi:hypothetical protein